MDRHGHGCFVLVIEPDFHVPALPGKVLRRNFLSVKPVRHCDSDRHVALRLSLILNVASEILPRDVASVLLEILIPLRVADLRKLRDVRDIFAVVDMQDVIDFDFRHGPVRLRFHMDSLLLIRAVRVRFGSRYTDFHRLSFIKIIAVRTTRTGCVLQTFLPRGDLNGRRLHTVLSRGAISLSFASSAAACKK